MNANLHALLESRFPADGEAVLFEVMAGDDAGRRVSYAEAAATTARLAGALRDLGVGSGDRVAVQVDKSPEAVLLYLACLKLGAVYLPLNVAYTAAEVGYFLTDAEPKVFVCRPEDVEELTPVAEAAGVARVVGLDGNGRGDLRDLAEAAEPVAAAAEVNADDLAAILYTSGTTGRSKGAMITHGNLASNALALHRLWGWRAGDVLLHALPVYHVHGLFVAVHCALLNGSPMLWLPRFEAAAVADLLPRATVMMGVPTHYVRLLEEPGLTREACAGVRLFVSGSAPLLEETWGAFDERTGHRILERYGMTEAGMITSNPYSGERVPGTVGYSLPDVEVRVVDDASHVCEENEIGCLEVRGPNVFAGYWRMAEKTAAAFRPGGWFVTSDLARLESDGRVILVGRARDLIISGGLNVYPKEVEGALDALEGVKESAVVGAPHPDLGEAVVACVVADGPVDEGELRESLRGTLAAFKIPKRVVMVGALPRNTMGKVQKTTLRDAVRDLFTES